MDNPGAWKIDGISMVIDLESGMSEVALGRGPRRLTEKILETFPASRVLGLEIDPLVVNFVRRQLLARYTDFLHQVRSSISVARLGDGRFDFAICRLALGRLTDPPDSMREVFRILKPHGRAVFLDNDFETHLIVGSHITELRELYDAYCRSRTSERGIRTSVGACQLC